MGQPRNRRSRFGPNADDVVDLLEQLERLSTAQVLALAAAGAALTGDRRPGEPPDARPEPPGARPGEPPDARPEPPGTRPDPRLAAARDRLRRLGEAHGRLGALRAAGDEVADWAASLAHWFPAGVAGGSEARSEIPPRMAALPVVLDVVYATVMEDLLTEDETDLLCAAWDEVLPEVPDADEQPAAGDEAASD